MLLSIFNTGGLTLGLSIVAIVLVGWLGYQAYMNRLYFRHPVGGKRVRYAKSERPPWYKLTHLWLAAFVVVAYIVVMFIVASDYKGV